MVTNSSQGQSDSSASGPPWLVSWRPSTSITTASLHRGHTGRAAGGQGGLASTVSAGAWGALELASQPGARQGRPVLRLQRAQRAAPPALWLPPTSAHGAPWPGGPTGAAGRLNRSWPGRPPPPCRRRRRPARRPPPPAPRRPPRCTERRRGVGRCVSGCVRPHARAAADPGKAGAAGAVQKTSNRCCHGPHLYRDSRPHARHASTASRPRAASRTSCRPSTTVCSTREMPTCSGRGSGRCE